MSLSDFNDLYIAAGIDAVRQQLQAGLVAANDSPAPPVEDVPPWGDVDEPTPPAPSEFEERVTLEGALARYSLTFPDGKIWDERTKLLIKKTAAKDLMGKTVFDEWVNHEKRRSIHQDLVKSVAAAAAANGGGGVNAALSRYVYLYPTSDAWDCDSRAVVSLSSLRYAIADCFDDWVKSDRRKQLPVENLVFDPCQTADLSTHINKFRGLPLMPVRDDSKCQGIIGLIKHLCNHSAPEIMWLTRWLAYPLQHVGAKMATSIMINSPVEGTGKSLLFEGVVKPIYGEYGTTVGQHQLESQYTDWISSRLFGVFEEVLSRSEKHNYVGLIKHLVTGATIQINKKFVSGWEERNHINVVFLSNELQPFGIDETDRRMMVIYPESTLPDDHQKQIQREINNGGIEAFYAYLLAYPLGDFNPHTKPLLNQAKADLIELSRPSWEGFIHDWLAGQLDIKPMPVTGGDLFGFYRSWADKRRENVVGERRFLNFLRKIKGIFRDKSAHVNFGYETKTLNVYVPAGQSPGEGETRQQWYGRSIDAFRKAIEESK